MSAPMVYGTLGAWLAIVVAALMPPVIMLKRSADLDNGVVVRDQR